MNRWHFIDLVINTELSIVSLLIDACFNFITSYDLLQALGILSVIAFLLFVRSQYLRVEQVRNQCTVRYEPQSCMDLYNYNNTWWFRVGHRFHTKFISTCNNISDKNFPKATRSNLSGSKILNFLGAYSQTPLGAVCFI